MLPILCLNVSLLCASPVVRTAVPTGEPDPDAQRAAPDAKTTPTLPSRAPRRPFTSTSTVSLRAQRHPDGVDTETARDTGPAAEQNASLRLQDDSTSHEEVEAWTPAPRIALAVGTGMTLGTAAGILTGSGLAQLCFRGSDDESCYAGATFLSFAVAGLAGSIAAYGAAHIVGGHGQGGPAACGGFIGTLFGAFAAGAIVLAIHNAEPDPPPIVYFMPWMVTSLLSGIGTAIGYEVSSDDRDD